MSKIWIAGVGGVGSWLAANLADAHDIVLVDSWAANIAAIRERGLNVRSPTRDFTVRLKAVHLDDLATIGEPPDLVLFAFKSYQTMSIIPRITSHLDASSVVVSLQNCVNEDVIAAEVGIDRTVGGICLYDGQMLGPGRSMRTREGGKIIIGEIAGEALTRVDAIAGMLDPPLSVETSTNMRGLLWSKLVRNVMTNPLCSLTGYGNGELVGDPVLRQLAGELARETILVAAGLDIRLEEAELYSTAPTAFVSRRGGVVHNNMLESFYGEYRGHNELKPAMLQDVLNGRRTEIDYLNGYVVAEGRRIGLESPGNAEMVRMVHELETGERRPTRSVIQTDLAPLLQRLTGQ